MKDHIAILTLASRNELPETIHWKSSVSYQAACELIEAGHLTGMHVNSVNGSTIFMPAITLSGRMFLDEQLKLQAKPAWYVRGYRFVKPVLGWVIAIFTAILIAWLTKVFVDA